MKRKYYTTIFVFMVLSSVISAQNYSFTFESDLNGWTQDTIDDFDWEIKTGATPSGNTGPSSASEGSYYLYVEASTPNHPSKTTSISSQNYTIGNNGLFSFDYHMYGTLPGTLTLFASTDAGVNWYPIWIQSGNQGNTWHNATIDLSGVSGRSVRFQFKGVTDNTWSGDMCIDNIQITSQPISLPNQITALSSNENYIYSLTPTKPTTNVSSLAYDEKIETVQYFDGLGRPKQSVAIRAGSNYEDVITHTTYDDYGRQDKEYLPYATTSNGGSYRIVNITNDINQYYQTKYADDFLNTITSEVNPYSEKHFEASPLNRVLEQAAPGVDWALDKDSDTDHTIKFEYSTNTGDDYVRIFSANTTYNTTNKIYESSLVDDGEIYPVGELYKTITKDENWKSSDGVDKTIEEYKNKQGQVILKRTFNNQKPHDTYYVYDDFGNLTYVFPPKVHTNASIVNHYYDYESNVWDFDVDIFSNTGLSPSNDFSVYFSSSGTMFIGIYQYDNPNSTLKPNKVYDFNFSIPLPDMNLGDITFFDYQTYNETVVGTASIQGGNLYFTPNSTVINSDGEFYISASLSPYQDDFTPLPVSATDIDELTYQYKYDSRNRLVEKKIPGKDWEYIIYDKLDRPIWTQDKNLRDQTGKEWLFTKYDALGRVTYTGMQRYDASRASTQNVITGVNSIYTQYEEKVSSNVVAGTNLYYSSNSAPKNPKEIYTINYYDTYVDLPSGFSPPTSVYSQAVTSRTKGLPTVSKVRVLETIDDWITTVTYYDEKARPIYMYSKNEYLNTVDIVESKLDFTGIVLETKTTHTKDTNTPIVTIDTFEYDHQNRLIAQKQTIGSQTEKLIAKNHYDELGQLARKDVGNNEINPLQQIGYTYNIRGWLKEINDIDDLNSGLFSFKINYNDPAYVINVPATALYNGNISQVEWRTNNVDNTLKSYTYNYDDLNRITKAKDGRDKFTVDLINYDKNGNIERLRRKGPAYDPTVIPNINNTSYTSMDYLFYTYDEGNKLLKVSDTSNNDYGFKDGTNSGDDYNYDDNGNMTSDENKNIQSISYNHLNLPTSIYFNNESEVYYRYAADGTKLSKTVTDQDNLTTVFSATVTSILYAGNYIYERYDSGNGATELQFFNHPEGYVKPKNSNDLSQGFDYIYQYKDHLGNVRLSYSDTDDNGIISGQVDNTTSVFEDDIETSSSWNSANTLYGISATRTSEKAKSGTYSVKIVNPNYNQYQFAHSDTWALINNSSDTEYIMSGWYYSTGPRVRMMLFMNENGETGYSTQSSSSSISTELDQWTYIEHRVVVPPNIDKLNLRIDTFGGGYDSAGTVWYDDLKIVKVNSSVASEIIEESNYYPFGLKHKGYNNVVSSNGNSTAQKFKYNGVEYEESLGLNLYEMDFRGYDPAIGRFNGIDPVTHYSQGTSVAFDNNPIFFADPSGADSIYNFDTNQYVINGEVVTQDKAFAYANAGGNADGSNDNTPSNDCEKNPEKCKEKAKKKDSNTDLGAVGLGIDVTTEVITPNLKNAIALTTIPVYDKAGNIIGQWQTYNKVAFKGLKLINGVLKPIGGAVNIADNVISTVEMANGKKSVTRWAVGLGGTGASMYAASAYGGLAGVLVGGTFYMGDLMLQAAEVSAKQRKEATESSRFKIEAKSFMDIWNGIGKFMNINSFRSGFSMGN